MAPKCLLLVYIHGFKGDHTTFASFPAQLTALLSHRLPHLSIRHLIFPTFETRGDLDGTVQKFRSWLEEKVIDIEVELGTASPTVDPGVGVVVVGHSMGGIVGAEAVLGVAGEVVLPATGGDTVGDEEGKEEQGTTDGRGESDGEEKGGIQMEDKTVPNQQEDREIDPSPKPDDSTGESTALLFPHIHGLLAFDTPYLGISPGVVAHGAEGHFKEGKAWYESAMGMFAAVAAGATAKEAVDPARKALPIPDYSTAPEQERRDEEAYKTQQAKQNWQGKWGKTALFASAGLAATTALGTTAYLKREQITSGFNWVSSHLEFVGCLARGKEMTQRLEKMQMTSFDKGIGFNDFYTQLAEDKGGGRGGRTFCNLPKQGSRLLECFRPAKNEKIGDEVGAHVGMFGESSGISLAQQTNIALTTCQPVPKENPGYYTMSEEVLELIVGWVAKSPDDAMHDVHITEETAAA